MNFYRSKSFWVATAIFFPLLMIIGYCEFKKITSTYKTDQGNGVVIYADDYVKTGKWVFHCNRSRLISRQPLPAPIAELDEGVRLTIGTMYALNDSDKALAKQAISAITKIDGWYKKLRYRYSALDDYSNIIVHDFDLLTHHNGRLWALDVSQWLDNRNRSSFKITAEPYDPETYIDHAKMLQAAAKSCPVPQ